jgi:tetratricopeptide (TPR) repeat protein
MLTFLVHSRHLFTQRPAHYNLAILLKQHVHDYRGAEVHYKAALKIEPQDAAAHYNLAVLLGWTLGRWADAAHHMKVGGFPVLSDRSN